MGSLVSAVGTGLIALSVGGAALLAFGPSPEDLIHGRARPVAPVARSAPVSAAPASTAPRAPRVDAASVGQIGPARVEPRPVGAPGVTPPEAPGASSEPAGAGGPPLAIQGPGGAAAAEAVEPLVATPITRVAIPSIGLDSEVVEAEFVERNGATTWEIPKFVAGHAQFTAGAGDLGNAVLLGHVSSLHSGDVFKDLDRVHIGDVISLFSKENEVKYHVTEVKTVDRTDTSMLETTDTATVSLFTCTGTWLPTVWDYSERLVVRGELIS